jgi:hypothetical protein
VVLEVVKMLSDLCGHVSNDLILFSIDSKMSKSDDQQGDEDMLTERSQIIFVDLSFQIIFCERL